MTNQWLISLLILSNARGLVQIITRPQRLTTSFLRPTIHIRNGSPTRLPKTDLPYQNEANIKSLIDSPPNSSDLSNIFEKEAMFRQDDPPNLPLLESHPSVLHSTAPATSLSDVAISFELPVMVQPRSEYQASLPYLQTFLMEQKEWINNMMKRYGAVMFRGFALDTAKNVEDAVWSYSPHLNNEYRGTSPRNVQTGTQFVFSAAEVPSHYPIAQHLEMSFLPSPPKQLYFSALKAPRTAGGETAVADFRKVYNDIPLRLRNKLQEKKLRYTRTHHEVAESNTHDVAAMQGWPELFGTNNKEVVQRIAREEGTPMKWEGKNGDTFKSEFTSEPFQRHPETGEPAWFNHAQVFHWTTFPAELFHAFRRTKDWRYFGPAMKVGLKSIWKYGILREKMALHVSFGDGTPISVWEMHQIRKAVHKNMVFNRWQKGDLLMIDNFSTSHGRQPTYDEGRNIVVAWSDPITKPNNM